TAMGNQLTTYDVKKIVPLEPIPNEYNPQNEMYTFSKRNVHFLVGCRHSKDRQKPSQLRAFLLHI
ncbi:hypothetical protein ACQ1PV_07485, partial [Ornithobacterium rhinotracheale]